VERKLNIDIDGVMTELGKYSNNLEKHGNEDVSCWALPCHDIPVPTDQLNELAEDAHCSRAFFNDNRGMLEPMPWLRNFELNYVPTFEGANVRIAFSENKEPEVFEKCKVKIMNPVPGINGITVCTLQVQLYPNRRQKTLIDEHQKRKVRIWIADSTLAEKKNNKQNDMFKPQEKQEGQQEPSASQPQPETGEPSNGLGSPETANTGGSSGESADTSSGSESTPVSQESSSETPSRTETPPSTEDDTAAFEAGLKGEVAAHVSKGRRGVVDGRTRRKQH
jgi:hypothetical protein